MAHNSQILFNKSIPQLRQLGARGGRACGRNRRRRRALMPPPEAVLLRQPLLETAAEAIAKLNGQFPWLHDAEKRFPVLTSL